MKAFTKWIGNKEQYLKEILPLFPKGIERYYDVFVGGGDIYLGAPDSAQYIVADSCRPLIDLYREAQLGDPVFVSHLKDINASWENLGRLFLENADALRNLYVKYPEGKEYDYLAYVEDLNPILEKLEYDKVFLQHYSDTILFEIEKRYHFTKRKEKSAKWKLKTNEVMDKYILTSLKTALYEYYMEVFNANSPLPVPLRKAILMFLLQFSSTGEFILEGRRKEFRPVYAGPTHNDMTLDNTIRLIGSNEFKERISKTEFHCQDFRKFFERRHPGPNDLVFVNLPALSDQDMADLLAILKRRKAMRFMLIAWRNAITPALDTFAANYHITLAGPKQELMIVTSYNPQES